eukprot:UN18850
MLYRLQYSMSSKVGVKILHSIFDKESTKKLGCCVQLLNIIGPPPIHVTEYLRYLGRNLRRDYFRQMSTLREEMYR